MKVGFVGLGRMGQGMAGRILAAGHDLLVSDPLPGQTTRLEEAGAVAVDSPAAATVDRDVVITMLPSDKILGAVLHGENGLRLVFTWRAAHTVCQQLMLLPKHTLLPVRRLSPVPCSGVPTLPRMDC